MDVFEGEDVLLGIEVVKLVPLCRGTGHKAYVVFFCKCIVEKEIVVPKIGERLVVALVARTLLSGNGLPCIFRGEVVGKPELGVCTDGALELKPTGERNLCCQVAQEIVAVGLLSVGLRGADGVACAAVPEGIAFRACPFAAFVLDIIDRQGLVGVAQIVGSLFLAVGADSDVVREL